MQTKTSHRLKELLNLKNTNAHANLQSQIKQNETKVIMSSRAKQNQILNKDKKGNFHIVY